MAGHSKWANIKRKKAGVDAARGKLFTKLIKEIAVAAKLGGPDPDANPRLRTAIDKAKGNSMPKDTIERAVARGAGMNDGADYERLTYEGYGPGGVAILVSCLTDNRARTAADVKHAFSKGGGSLGTPGSVAYLFQQKAIFDIESEDLDEDQVMTAALEGDAEDVDRSEEGWTVTAPFEAYAACRRALEQLGAPIRGEVEMVPDVLVPVSGDDANQLLRLLERIDDLDDVQDTYSNADIDEQTVAAHGG